MGIPSIPPAKPRPDTPQSFDPNRSNYVPPIWGITMQQAAEALMVMTGNGPMRITDQWGSIRAGYIEPTGLIGDSSDGIEMCGYEEL
jgi:hypothetical protein